MLYLCVDSTSKLTNYCANPTFFLKVLSIEVKASGMGASYTEVDNYKYVVILRNYKVVGITHHISSFFNQGPDTSHVKNEIDTILDNPNFRH